LPQFSTVLKEPVCDGLIFSNLMQVNASFSHVSIEGGAACFHFKSMRWREVEPF